MTRSLLLVGLAWSASIGLGGCGMGPDSAAPAHLVSGLDEHPALGSIETRAHRITFRGGAGGPRFTVQSLDGRVLGEALTYEELAASHPELLRLVRGFAAGGPVGGLDARVSPPVPGSDGHTPLLLAD